jgi:hypothetical protein
MALVDIRPITLPRDPSAESHTRQSSQTRQTGTENGTYGEAVPPPQPSTDRRVRAFGQFIKTALADARDRGMSIADVEAAIKRFDPVAKVGRSSFYRWTRNEVESPQRRQVQAFCGGLGIPLKVPAQILGWNDPVPAAEPDPTTDPDLRAVGRILMDPTVPAEEKTVIRATLRHLARRR